MVVVVDVTAKERMCDTVRRRRMIGLRIECVSDISMLIRSSRSGSPLSLLQYSISVQ